MAKFLSGLGQRWNISMFHYRNHGAAYGRILVGVQVPASEKRDFTRVLEEIDYRYWDETDNLAYQLYLGQREQD
jgi:threonine dehydratase